MPNVYTPCPDCGKPKTKAAKRCITCTRSTMGNGPRIPARLLMAFFDDVEIKKKVREGRGKDGKIGFYRADELCCAAGEHLCDAVGDEIYFGTPLR